MFLNYEGRSSKTNFKWACTLLSCLTTLDEFESISAMPSFFLAGVVQIASTNKSYYFTRSFKNGKIIIIPLVRHLINMSSCRASKCEQASERAKERDRDDDGDSTKFFSFQLHSSRPSDSEASQLGYGYFFSAYALRFTQFSKTNQLIITTCN